MQILGIVYSNNLDFIVLSKYILPEKYQKSGMLKAKIWIVEEMPTVGFYANNNLDFLIFLHNPNHRKNIKKSSLCLILHSCKYFLYLSPAFIFL